MGPVSQNTISSFKASPVSKPTIPSVPLRGAVFYGGEGCEHEVFLQPIEIIPGTGADAGTVAFQIGAACIRVNSSAALLAALASSNKQLRDIPIIE